MRNRRLGEEGLRLRRGGLLLLEHEQLVLGAPRQEGRLVCGVELDVVHRHVVRAGRGRVGSAAARALHRAGAPRDAHAAAAADRALALRGRLGAPRAAGELARGDAAPPDEHAHVELAHALRQVPEREHRPAALLAHHRVVVEARALGGDHARGDGHQLDVGAAERVEQHAQRAPRDARVRRHRERRRLDVVAVEDERRRRLLACRERRLDRVVVRHRVE